MEGRGEGGSDALSAPRGTAAWGGRPAAPLRHVSRPDVAAFCPLQRWRRGGAGLRPRGRRRARTADGAGRRGAMVARGLRALRGALRGAAGSGGRRLSTRPARVPAADYQDAIRTLNTLQTNASYLEQVKRERGDPRAQLEAMRGFLERSGLQVEDLDRLNIIHVTGTKGKGSACAFTERILRGYGLRTGFYSSPHLVQVRERIRINGQPLSKELFSKYFWLVYRRLRGTKDESQANMPAYFRFLTIMAFHVFLQEKVDLAVVEVGIGGAFDCTNIIRAPVVCGVSSLGIDHTSILGDTVEKIAWQKGGIFKPGVPAFTVPQPEQPLEVLRDRARECGCPLYLCPELDAFEAGTQVLELGLAGSHQRSNAALALQLSRTWLQRRGYEGTDVLQDVLPGAELSAQRSVPLAPTFCPSDAMIQGLRDTEWPGRTQVLPHGPVTWYIDGAHTTSSIQACVRWFRQAALNEDKPQDGSEVRVLLFNATGDRDTAALLKLLLPCHFDYAVFCPNFTEVSVAANSDQQNFNVTLENALTRCVENQKTWTRLMEEKGGPWLPAPLEVGGLLQPDPLRGALLLVPPAERPLNSTSLVFPCISHALQWITQGRDPHLPLPASKVGAHPHPVATSGAVLLQEAAAIRVLVTGSLHLVGGVLKLLDPTLSQ
ncbi:folylpolyglutamate synthase, mitochondrial isoform X10 [Gallus gallus]|uniref:folylpolyglutamate synthase, mitochondrial isoform X10 n=1 Tax=Gallus gallus TaxID=9031 RepID=UPI001F0229D5|nr:folylpolyglutamate synthase, mitochondrial isoform X10 [Gallus gallus]XP_040541787.2 folylpolyglutamate synthase, mitochondrial isoform X10 [Gallus gallus]